MAGAGSLQRSPGGPTPRTDVQVAKDAWKFVQRKIQKHRTQSSAAEDNLHKTQSHESTMSEANTIVAASSDNTSAKGPEK